MTTSAQRAFDTIDYGRGTPCHIQSRNLFNVPGIISEADKFLEVDVLVGHIVSHTDVLRRLFHSMAMVEK